MKAVLIFIFFFPIFVFIGCISTSHPKAERARLHLEIGDSHLQANRLPQALQSFLEAEKLAPNDYQVQRALGITYMARERYDLAEKHFKKAISENPQSTLSRNDLTQLYLQQKKFKLAEELLHVSLADLTFPQPDRTYYLYGYLKFETGEFRAALTQLEKSIKFNKSDCFSQNYFGRTLFELERYSEASNALDQAVGLCKQNGFDEPHYFSALAYYRIGESDKSRARFQEITKFYPDGKYREKAKAMLDVLAKVSPE